jgi:hypothetical protein
MQRRAPFVKEVDVAVSTQRLAGSIEIGAVSATVKGLEAIKRASNLIAI